MAALLQFEHVTKRFGGVTALDDVSFSVQQGSFHAIVGENGAGKSTLMKILSGVHTEYDGRFLLSGQPVDFAGTRDAETAGVAIIHQELNLVEELSTAANIFLGRELRNSWGLLNDRAMEAAARDLFTQLECTIDARQPVGMLRVGDQQLVEIAKALSLNAEVLIMDEPTSALTETEVERLFRVIAKLRSAGVTILYISHKMDEVFSMSDTITILRDGQVVDTRPTSETSPREITHAMVGRDLHSTESRPQRTPGEVLLTVKQLSLPWPGHARKWRLENISFELRAGEVLGFAGLMGAGRTELLECLFGTSPHPPQGEILVNGMQRSFAHPREAMQAGIALVTEDRKRLGLFDHMTVRDNITICTLGEAVRGGVVNARKERELADESVGLLGVKTDGVEAPILSLSGGNQQKCIIARWLRTQPQILLLDDPTRGIDVGAKAELYSVVNDLCQQGMGIVITSSELPELLTVCDRVLVLCEGRLTGEFAGDSLTEQNIMEAATSLDDAANPNRAVVSRKWIGV